MIGQERGTLRRKALVLFIGYCRLTCLSKDKQSQVPNASEVFSPFVDLRLWSVRKRKREEWESYLNRALRPPEDPFLFVSYTLSLLPFPLNPRTIGSRPRAATTYTTPSFVPSYLPVLNFHSYPPTGQSHQATAFTGAPNRHCFRELSLQVA